MHEVVFSRIIVVVIALTAGLVSASASVAQTARSQPGGSASISYPPGEQSTPGSNTLNVPSGTAVVTISWDASCPPYSGDSDPQDWSWSVTVGGTYPDGRDAFDSGYIGPGLGKRSWRGHQGFAVSMEHAQDKSATIAWEVQLHCGSATTDPMTLGSGSFMLMRCDPNASANAQREYLQADKLLAEADRELAEAERGDEELYHETGHEGAVASVQAAILHQALEALEKASSELLKISPPVAVAAEITHAANDLANLLEKIELNSQDWSRLNDEAAADFRQAGRLIALGNSDLALVCTDILHNQLSQLLAHQKLLEDSQREIDGWEIREGSWVNPITHEGVSESEALKQAEAMLTGGPPAPGDD